MSLTQLALKHKEKLQDAARKKTINKQLRTKEAIELFHRLVPEEIRTDPIVMAALLKADYNDDYLDFEAHTEALNDTIRYRVKLDTVIMIYKPLHKELRLNEHTPADDIGKFVYHIQHQQDLEKKRKEEKQREQLMVALQLAYQQLYKLSITPPTGPLYHTLHQAKRKYDFLKEHSPNFVSAEKMSQIDKLYEKTLEAISIRTATQERLTVAYRRYYAKLRRVKESNRRAIKQWQRENEQLYTVYRLSYGTHHPGDVSLFHIWTNAPPDAAGWTKLIENGQLKDWVKVYYPVKAEKVTVSTIKDVDHPTARPIFYYDSMKVCVSPYAQDDLVTKSRQELNKKVTPHPDPPQKDDPQYKLLDEDDWINAAKQARAEEYGEE